MRDIPTPTPQDIDADINSAEGLHRQLAAAIAEAEKTGDFTKAEEIQKQLAAKLEPLKEEAKIQADPVMRRERKIAADGKTLVAIEQKLQAGQNLDPSDLRFIYEIDDRIDSKHAVYIDMLRKSLGSRDKRADLSAALDVPPERISLTPEEALKGNIAYHYGNLDLNSLSSAEGIRLPDQISAGLFLDSLVSAEGLKFPNRIQQSLSLNSLTSAEGLRLPNRIDGSLSFGSLISIEGLELPGHMGGFIYLGAIANTERRRLREKYPNLTNRII